MIEEDNNYKPFSADTLPLPHDSDQDGAADDIDVSHIYETAPQPAGQKEIVIGPKDSLTQKPMEMDVVTRFDFDDFLPGTLGLIQIITTKISLKEKISHTSFRCSFKMPSMAGSTASISAVFSVP